MKRVLAAVLAVAMVWSAAADVVVTNYNWLQLAPDKVTPFLGNPDMPFITAADTETAATMTVNGKLSDIRWGNYVWIPTYYLTNAGQGEYWGGVMLDQPRNITAVNVQLWGSGTEQTQQFYVEASLDGTHWTTVSVTLDRPETDQRPVPVLVPFPESKQGDYQYIRVRFDPADGGYTATGSYGGPGLLTVEPIGGGALKPGDTVNWANNASFETSIKNVFSGNWGGNQWHDGSFAENHSIVGSLNDMNEGGYLQINLGAERTVDNVLGVCHNSYVPASFQVWVSTADDENAEGFADSFTLLTPLGSELYPLDNNKKDALGYDFAPAQARFVRIMNVTKPDGGEAWMFTQVLVNGTVVPEPATMSLLTLGALTLLRRRR